MSSGPWDYKVLIEMPGDPVTLKSRCGSCGWQSTADALDEIKDASLTPGDPSPAGRCPECGGLVYLDREIDRQRDYAAEAFALLQRVRAARPGQHTGQISDVLAGEIDALLLKVAQQ